MCRFWPEQHWADPYCTEHPLVSILWTNPGGCAHEDARRQKQLAVLETPLYPYTGKLRHMRACSSGVSSSRQAAGSAHCHSKARSGATPGDARPKAAQATRLAHAPIASSPAVSSRAGHGSRRPCCQTGPWQCGGCIGLGEQWSWPRRLWLRRFAEKSTRSGRHAAKYMCHRLEGFMGTAQCKPGGSARLYSQRIVGAKGHTERLLTM